VFFVSFAKCNYFAECFFFFSALGKELLCRVSDGLHSANHIALGLPSVSGSDGAFDNYCYST